MLFLLDIDGVMVPATSWKPQELLTDGFYDFKKKAVDTLNKLISETGASIVLTSSHKSRFTASQWKDIFKNRGINVSIELLDKNVNNLNRKDEVLNWLRNHAYESYIIIDDDKSLNDLPSHVKQNLVLTNSLIGFNEESYNTAINIIEDSHLIAI